MVPPEPAGPESACEGNAEVQVATPEPAPEETVRHASAALGRKVLEEAERLGLPPEPETYARLWRSLGGPGGPDGGAAAAPPPPPDPGDEALLRYGDLLGSELGAVLAVLERRSAADGEFIARLDGAGAALPRFARPSTVREAIGTLRETAADHALRIAAFSDQLRTAHDQIAELRGELECARHAAAQDALTGLANRGRFDVALADAVALGRPFALVLADLDHFKAVNDVHGHQAGDAILRHFAEIVRASVRAGDLAARFGGEEFALILRGVGAAGARQVAERIRQEFGALSFRATGTGTRIGSVTASLGVAVCEGDCVAADVLARADAALYRAKRQGRNRVATD